MNLEKYSNIKTVKIIYILFIGILIQSCKSNYPIIPIKSTFNKVSSYAGTCEKAQGFCIELSDELSNGTIKKTKKGFEMKISRNDVSESFIKEILKTKTFVVDKDYYLPKKLTNKLFEKEKSKSYKLKIKKGKYPIKIEKDINGKALIIWIHLQLDFYMDGEYIGSLTYDIIICFDC